MKEELALFHMCVSIDSLPSKIEGRYFQVLRNLYQVSRPENPSVSKNLLKWVGEKGWLGDKEQETRTT